MPTQHGVAAHFKAMFSRLAIGLSKGTSWAIHAVSDVPGLLTCLGMLSWPSADKKVLRRAHQRDLPHQLQQHVRASKIRPIARFLNHLPKLGAEDLLSDVTGSNML